MKEFTFRRRKIITWEVQFYHDKSKTWQEWNSFSTYKEAKKFYDSEFWDVRLIKRITFSHEENRLLEVKRL